jgi:putative heme-binding domain-containing protein
VGLVPSRAQGAQQAGAAAVQTNPRANDPEAVEEGKYLFKGRCAVCHGMDAKGYRGTDLTSGEWVHGGTDEQLFRTLSRGVPGTEMPATGLRDEEAWAVIAYLRTLAGPAGAVELRGNATRGEDVFWARNKGNCGQCHMVQVRGGRLGPNLSRIGAARSVAALEREVRRPHELVPVGFETVTVVTRDGRKLRGARKNEDTFSIQIMTFNEDIHSFNKRDVTQVIDEKESLMPVYGAERLSATDFDDLLRYLKTLRGTTPSSQP